MGNLKQPFVNLDVFYFLAGDRMQAKLSFGHKSGQWVVHFPAEPDGSVSRKAFAKALRQAASRISPPTKKG